MKRKSKILVLLASYLGEKFIEEQIKTILNQKNVQIKILISDDSSKDSTTKIIKNLMAYNNNISLVKNKKRFGSAARNFFNLIENAEIDFFDYIAFSDQDDIWFEDKLDNAIDKIEKTNCCGLSTDVLSFTSQYEGQKLIKKSYDQTQFDYWFEGPGPGCSFVIKKKSFKLLKDFIIRKKNDLKSIDYHDWFIYAFFRFNNLKWYISNEPKMFYRQHDRNQIGANLSIKAKLFRLKEIQNSWYRNQIIKMFKIISDNNFNKYIKTEKLFLKPLKLKRKKIDSLIIWFLLILKYFSV